MKKETAVNLTKTVRNRCKVAHKAIGECKDRLTLKLLGFDIARMNLTDHEKGVLRIRYRVQWNQLTK